MMHLRKWLVLIINLILFLFYLLAVNFFTDKSAGNTLSQNGFVGEQQCQSCHLKQHSEWKQSDHFNAMLPASDSTVLGDFNNKTFSADGVTSAFFKKGNEFYIKTQGPDGKNHDYKVLYTFGYYPLQQYLVAFPGGRMQVTRVSWDAKKKTWFHQYTGQKIATSDWLHWTHDAQNWNTMCATCHSTNLQKNYNLEQDNYHTTYSSVNVGCESCHGPGKLHVDYIRSAAYKDEHKVPNSYIQSCRTQAEQLTTCAPCHALQSGISAIQIKSEELLDNYIPQIPTTERYYADGQMKEENYIYASFLQSKMMRRGVTCANCHSMHTGKLLFSSNQLCLQCHNKSYDAPSHHFHQVGTKAAECISCHMPGRYYMGNDFRHDHSLRVPRPDLTVKFGTPNACNTCHTNQSPLWAANAVIKHFGKERKYHFSEDLIPGSRQDAKAESHLLKLLKDTAVPSIIKATSLYYLGNIPTQESLSDLLNGLQNAEALVRYNSLRSLANFPFQQWKEVALPLLQDKVRAVRIAAADLFLTVPVEQIPENYKGGLARAKEELQDYLLYQADFADGNVMIGDHYLRLNDFSNAQKFYLRGLKKDSLLNYARLNLSVAYSAMGNHTEALKTLKTAAAISPQNDRVFYNLALLYTEIKDTVAAIQNFEKAVNLKSQNPRLYYNYGLLLFQKVQVKKADDVLLKGLNMSPGDEDLIYALAYVYVQSKQWDKAKKYIQKLRTINPTNPGYQSLFQLLQN